MHYIPIQKPRQTPPPRPKRHYGRYFILLLVAVGGLWVFRAYHDTFASAAIAEIKAGVPNVCLDLYHDQATPGAPVTAAYCNGRPSQFWTIQNNTIRHHDLCLSEDMAHGRAIVAATCSGQPDQAWQYSYLGSFENPTTGDCLALSGRGAPPKLVASTCNDLTGPTETWAASTWSRTNLQPATISCNFPDSGRQIGCLAAKQWIAWQQQPSSHPALLNTYSDGNGYEEWCADFVSYIYKAANVPLTNGERNNWDENVAGYVRYDGNFAYHAAGSYTPQPGDVAYFDYPGGHVELVLVGGSKPVFVYGDSAKIDPVSKNGDMAENEITQDGDTGQVTYYLSLRG